MSWGVPDVPWEALGGFQGLPGGEADRKPGQWVPTSRQWTWGSPSRVPREGRGYLRPLPRRPWECHQEGTAGRTRAPGYSGAATDSGPGSGRKGRRHGWGTRKGRSRFRPHPEGVEEGSGYLAHAAS